ncbi:AdoMet-dependent rRNA methyltransferase spb1 [Nowakowskiella sp. JEL0078]|nr:AdoMet-dependent rRNA methyltransferase spb1 [Nowakowskiella sp. JEL0078]
MQKEKKSIYGKSENSEDSDSDESDYSQLSKDENDTNEDMSLKKRKRESISDVTFESIQENGSAKLSKRAQAFFDNPLFKGIKVDADSKPKKKNVKIDDDDETGDKEFFEGVKKAKKEKREGKEKDDKIQHVPKTISQNKEMDDDEDADAKFVISTAAEYTLAQKMLTNSGKNDVIDDAYNRFSFNDPQNLPAWFTEDEGRHNKISLPITKEAVEIMKARQVALDARPIKKVLEARFRTKMRSQKKMDKLQKKAAIMAEDDDLSEAQKLKKIRSLMSTAKSSTKKRETKVVVAKGTNRAVKGRPTGVKGRYKMVDPRMKKELRAEKRKLKKNGNRRK